jgi:hypothetical protein
MDPAVTMSHVAPVGIRGTTNAPWPVVDHREV